jgi:hypothetical protein
VDRPSLPSGPFPEPEKGLDELVRAKLDAEASRIDATPLFSNILSRLEKENLAEIPKPRRVWPKKLAFAMAIGSLAAVLFLSLTFWPAGQEVMASPTEIVEAARSANPADSIRHYQMTLDLPPRAREMFPYLANGPRSIYTCGDQFVVEPGFGGKGAWGRDEQGRLWIAPTRDGAAIFDEKELPQSLRNVVTIHELQLDSLLEETLADFELNWSQTPHKSDAFYSITATRKNRLRPFRVLSAELVIDKKTKVIQSLVLHRKAFGEETARLTFQLQPAESNAAVSFQLKDHLKESAPSYDHSRPVLRRRLIAQQIGEILASGL